MTKRELQHDSECLYTEDSINLLCNVLFPGIESIGSNMKKLLGFRSIVALSGVSRELNNIINSSSVIKEKYNIIRNSFFCLECDKQLIKCSRCDDKQCNDCCDTIDIMNKCHNCGITGCYNCINFSECNHDTIELGAPCYELFCHNCFDGHILEGHDSISSEEEDEEDEEEEEIEDNDREEDIGDTDTTISVIDSESIEESDD